LLVPFRRFDAVSINQLDIQERNIQVKFMAEIYKRCSRCLVWLGEVDEDGDAAFDFIKELACGGCVLPGDALVPHPSPSSCGTILESLSKFVRRPWWERMWVVQEVALPPDVEYWYSRRMVNQRVLWVAWESLNNIWSEATEESRSAKTLWLRDELIQNFLNGCLFRIKPYELGKQDDSSWDRKWDLLRLMAMCRTRSCRAPG
jgi:hypothetical protein